MKLLLSVIYLYAMSVESGFSSYNVVTIPTIAENYYVEPVNEWLEDDDDIPICPVDFVNFINWFRDILIKIS